MVEVKSIFEKVHFMKELSSQSKIFQILEVKST